MTTRRILAISLILFSLTTAAPILIYASTSESGENPSNIENQNSRNVLTNIEQRLSNESIQYRELESRNNAIYIEYFRNYTSRSQLLNEAGKITSVYVDALNSTSRPYPDRLVANLRINDSSILEYTADTELSLALLNDSINVTQYSKGVLKTFEVKNDTR